MKVNGLKLWAVHVEEIADQLWITGPLSSVVRKATAFCRRVHKVKRPTIKTIKYRGTLDA